MGVRLPRAGRELVPARLQHAVRPPVPASWGWFVPPAALAVLLVVVVLASGPAVAVRSLAWLAIPFLAAAAWARAALRTRARARLAFIVLSAAGFVAVAGQLLWTLETTALGRAAVPLPVYILLIPNVLLAVGAAAMLGPRPPSGKAPALATDAVLILLAGGVAALRLVVEPVLRTAGGLGDLALMASLQAAAALPVFVAALLVLRRGSALAPRAAALLLGATLLFAAASLHAPSPSDPLPFSTGGTFGLLWLGGWLLLGSSGLDARRLASTSRGMMAGRRAHDQVRRLIVPAAALFLTLAILDFGLGPRPRAETVAVAALLGLVLAVRSAYAFTLVDREASQRRQLAHTQALVEVSHSLAGTTDLDDTLRVISESARSVFGTRAAGIELVTEDGRTLELRSAVGLPDHALGLRFPIEGSFTGWVVQHGEARATADPSRDPYIQPQSRDFLGRLPVAAAPIRFRDETLGALFACIRSEPFDVEELDLLGAMAEQAAIGIKNARLFEQVTILSITDPLTGLANRRQLERELAREFAAAGRGRGLVVVVFDLDEFKSYNDAHGHLAGDEALQAFARALEAETRAMNLAARYGGDEFMAILSDADLDGASMFIERVTVRFDAAVRALGRGAIGVSAGAAAYRPELAAPEELIRRADSELYRVKPRART